MNKTGSINNPPQTTMSYITSQWFYYEVVQDLYRAEKVNSNIFYSQRSELRSELLLYSTPSGTGQLPMKPHILQ